MGGGQIQNLPSEEKFTISKKIFVILKKFFVVLKKFFVVSKKIFVVSKKFLLHQRTYQLYRRNFLNLHGFCHFELISSYILENLASNERGNPCAEGAKNFLVLLYGKTFFYEYFHGGAKSYFSLALPFSAHGRALLP